MAGSRSRSRAGTKSRTIDRCKIASRIAANAVAEAGSTSEEEPPRATGDELLDLLQDFDPDDSDIERCLEHEKQNMIIEKFSEGGVRSFHFKCEILLRKHEIFF